MNKKVLITLSLGTLSLLLLMLSSIVDSFAFLTMSLALVGSFIGIWYLFSLMFKSLVLDKKEKLSLFGGTLASLIAFGLGRYGFMLFFWLPGALVSIFFLQLLIRTLSKTSTPIARSLQEKITDVEEDLG